MSLIGSAKARVMGVYLFAARWESLAVVDGAIEYEVWSEGWVRAGLSWVNPKWWMG